MLIDEAEMILKGGHGGPGKVSFYPKAKSGPDGGDGGKGGNVYIKATSDLTALRPYTVKKTIAAENGQAGMSFQKSGRDGKDITLEMPIGTLIEVKNSDETFELTTPDQTILVAKGGLGGRGNYALRSSRNTTPMFAQPGLPGEVKDCKVILKLIADFGLIGLPNAGKSSLLNELTKANAKVGNYHFTTLEPNLGVLEGKIIADIPGLIEGASAGKGLGIKFLKHIEKTHTLLHCISSESDDVVRDYKIIRKELEQYKSLLIEKNETILLTKIDLVSKEDLDKKIVKLKKLNKNIVTVSVYDLDSLTTLKNWLLK